MKPVIFAGPNLDVQQAAEILDATYLPPAGNGDVLGAVQNLQPTAIGLIDGVWNAQTVWHREIMLALDKGIPVYGSSHLGAIRAVELGPCGMIGVGKIYEYLQDQDFLDYGETGLTWQCEGSSYVRTSEPMANVRATLALVMEKGLLDRDSCRYLEETAQSIFYQERTWDKIIRACSEHMPAKQLEKLSSLFTKYYIDQQSEDALELVKCLQAPAALLENKERSVWRDYRSVKAMQERYVPINRPTGQVRRSEIAAYAALNLPDYHEINFNALNRKLVMLLAQEWGIQSDPELAAIEEERFRRRKKLRDEQNFASWLQDNDCTYDQFKELMVERAVCHRLHRWLMQVKQPYNRNTKAVLEELKLRGDFPQMADKAAARKEMLREQVENQDQAGTAEVTDLFREHLKNTDIPWEYDYRVVIQEYGLSFADFYWELHKSKLAREYLRDLVLGKKCESED